MISIKERSHYGIKTNIITIAIQGTDMNNGFDEWSMDLFNLAWFGTCRDRVLSDLKSHLTNNGISINDSRNIYFITGHSLGAAAANLLEASLLDDYGCEPSQIYGYNFACPLTLNLINKPLPWNRWKYSCIFNLNNERDPIPHLGKACRFGEESSIRKNESVDERLQDVFGKKTNDAFAEHDVDVYMAAVLNDSCLDVSKDDGKTYTVSLNSSNSSYSDLVNGELSGGALYSIRCPVDVEVLDADGNVVASIVNNAVAVESKASDVIVCALLDEKYIYISGDGSRYHFRISGNDEGAMSYTVTEFGEGAYPNVKTSSFENVEISNEKAFLASSEDGSAELKVVDGDGAFVADVHSDGVEEDSEGNLDRLNTTILLSDAEAVYTGEPLSINPAEVSGSSGGVSYTYYTDEDCLTTTSAACGAKTGGGAPTAIGRYYVKATNKYKLFLIDSSTHAPLYLRIFKLLGLCTHLRFSSSVRDR